jgi:hypothetical protein
MVSSVAGGIPLKMNLVDRLMNGAREVAEGGGERESRIGIKALRNRRPGEASGGKEVREPSWMEIVAILPSDRGDETEIERAITYDYKFIEQKNSRKSIRRVNTFLFSDGKKAREVDCELMFVRTLQIFDLILSARANRYSGLVC